MDHSTPSPDPRRRSLLAPAGALFVSRWGALLERSARGQAPRLERARFAPGALDLLFRAVQAGWHPYLIGNEPRVARGAWSEQACTRFREEVVNHLRGLGIPVVRDYACTYHPRGRGRFRRESVFRFPNTGALYHAAHLDGVRLGSSWLISDDAEELAAGGRAGCRTIRLPRHDGELVLLDADPHDEAQDLADALHLLLGTRGARRSELT